MIKLVKISSNEISIVFQTGNGGEFEAIPYGNTGKDLYFYHLKVSSNSFQVVRYDYIYNNYRLRTNYEDYTIYIIATSPRCRGWSGACLPQSPNPHWL